MINLFEINQVLKFQRDIIMRMIRLSLNYKLKKSRVSRFIADTPYLTL